MPSEPRPATIKVWDPLVRTIHWSMVACVATAWTITDGAWHDGAGYVLLALVAVRLIWGWAGPPYARFVNFVHGPRPVWRYAQMVLARKEPRHIGHNPLGGWMIVALLGTALAASISGALYTTDMFWGVAWIESLHVFFAELLLVLATLHVLGVVFTSIRQRENLVAAMFSGRKRPPDTEQAHRTGAQP